MNIIKKLFYVLLVTIFSLIMFSSLSNAATNVKVTTDSLNLREEASTDADVLTTISENETCELIEELDNWYKVKYKTFEGYISKDYSKKEEAKTETTGTTGTTENKETKTETNLNKTVKMLQNADIKISPLIYSSNILYLEKGTEVTVIAKINGWDYIESKNGSGWVRNDKVGNEEKNNQNSEKKEESSNKKEEKSEETNKNTEQQYEEKTMYINESYVNLRKEASTDSEVIMVVEENTKLTVIGEKGDWYKVSTSNGEAYVLKSLVSTSAKTTSRGTVSRIVENSSDNVDTTKTTNNTSTTKKTTEKTTTTSETTTTTSSSSTKGEEVVTYAKTFLGVPYVYGGASKSGFDCSGFTMYVFKHFGISMRHGAQDQATLGKAVKYDKSSSSSIKNNLKPGDLVFFLDYETMDEIGHVGIYVGDGNFIHASSGSGYCVKINSLLPGDYYNTRFCEARRVI